MTITCDEHVTVRILTKDEARAEVSALLKQSGMSREELGRRGDDFELDEQERMLLADIEGLEWMIQD